MSYYGNFIIIRLDFTVYIDVIIMVILKHDFIIF